MSETPNTVHGRLLEAAHISGYTAKRAVTELEWLLEEDRWKEVGPGYQEIDAFLSSIDLSEFKMAIERRKSLVRKLAAIQASQVKTAAAIGVSRKTVQNDLQEVAPAAFQIPSGKVAAAVEKQAKRKGRESALGGRREARERAAREQLAEAGYVPDLHVVDLREWNPGLVDAVITDPPYVGDSLPLYEALRDFALRSLKDGGALVAMTWQAILPDVIRALDHPELVYRWTLSWRFDSTENTVDHARRVFDCWKPVLVFHKGEMPADAPMFRDEIGSAAPDKAHHEWGQSLDGFVRLVTSFTQPGEVVCDPFLGAGTTAVAALEQARRFCGCDIDESAVETTRRRLQ